MIMKKYRSKIDEIQAIELYNLHKNIAFVARQLNCDEVTLGRRLKDLSVAIKKSKYKGFNENYFDKIDTQEKAYFFGLLMADGCNYTKAYRVSLCLIESDVNVIEKFKKELNAEYPIKLVKSNNKNHQNRKYLQINSKIMSKRLEEIGCVNNKSTILKFPYGIVPENLMSHFIRGIFDGDGSICTSVLKKNDYKYHIFNITGNPDFLLGIQEQLIKNCKVNKTKLNTPKRYKNGTAMLCYGGSINISKIREWLYKDATIFIQRKKDKFFTIDVKNKKNYKHI